MGHIKWQEKRVDELIPNPHNARLHSKQQIRKLKACIAEFGFCNPVLVDEGNHVIAGHARLEAAKQSFLETVSTIIVSGLTKAQKIGLALADNRLSEDATWDLELLDQAFEELVEIDADFDLEFTGFEMAEIDLLISGASDSTSEEDGADELPEAHPEPFTKPGDLFRLDHHRLFCGDATEPESFDTLMGGKKARMIFTDPPYNVPIDGHVSGLGKVKHGDFVMASGEMSEDEYLAFLRVVFRQNRHHSTDGSVHFVCMDWRHLSEALNAGQIYSKVMNLCVWVKTNGGMGSLYRSQHELVLVFKNGTASHINNVQLGKLGRYRTNVWTYPGVNTFGKGRLEELRMHPTVKPVALTADAMLDCSKRGSIVLDPFAGSGTTIIAAEKTGRRAFAMELDPIYVEVAIRRWQNFTGRKAVHDGSGLTFEALAKKRRKSRDSGAKRSSRPLKPKIRKVTKGARHDK